jgi:hypothetical protein
MRTKSVTVAISAITLGLLCQATVHAADNVAAKIRVSVKVAANGSVKAEFESYVKRELRGLKDVEIVETSPDFSLSFVVVQALTKEGTDTGYAISELVTSPVTSEAYQSMFKGKLSEEELAWLRKTTDSAVYIERQKIQTCDSGGLKSTCEKLVAEFDTDELESSRKLHREIHEITGKQPKKP